MAIKKNPPQGKLYSELYIERGEPKSDSIAFRRRLGYFIDEELDNEISYEIAKVFKLRTGTNITSSYGTMGTYFDFEEFLVKCSLPHALDLITIAAKVINHTNPYRTERFLNFVKRVFSEEHLQYQIDEKGGVHDLVDQEFQHSKECALAALSKPRYNAARHEYEKGFDFLTATNPDFKAAIRSIFECAEIIFKERFKTKNLSKAALLERLKPLLSALYKDDEVSESVALYQLDQMISWVQACHYYRHGQVADKPQQPDPHIAIGLISSGACIIRWLVDVLEKQTNSKLSDN